MKKLSPEFRVGVVAVTIIVLFIWLFSFLKGRNLLSNYDQYRITYENIAGLDPSSPVEISGLRAGVVSSVKLLNDGSGMIEVLISIEEDYNIPDNSIAEITTATLIAGMKIDLILGNSKTFLNSGDYIKGRLAVSIVDKLNNNFDPVLDDTRKLIRSIDTLVNKISTVFTPEFSDKINQSSSNLNEVSGDLRTLLNKNTENLTELIANLNSVGIMLENNIGKFDSTITSANNISNALSGSDIDSTLASLKMSLETSTSILQKLNKGEGSAGKFMNDDSLYLNLTNSLNSLDILLKDIEKNPRKYVHFSIFGKNKE